MREPAQQPSTCADTHSVTSPIAPSAGLPVTFQPPDLRTLTQSQGAAAISSLIANTALVQALFPSPSLYPTANTPTPDPMGVLLQSAFTYQLANAGNSAVLSMFTGQQTGQLLNASA